MVPFLQASTVSANRIVLPIMVALLALGVITYSVWSKALIRNRSRMQLAETQAKGSGETLLRPNSSLGVRLSYGDPQGRCDGSYQMIMAGGTTVLSEARTQTSTIHTELLLSQRCTQATTGYLQLETKIDAGTISVNGAPSPVQMIGHVVKTKISRDGTILANDGYQGFDVKSMQLVLPNIPVREGYTWTVAVPASDAVPIALEVQYCIDRIISLVGEKRVRISTSVESVGQPNSPFAKLSVRAKGEIWFSVERGLMLSNDVDSQMEGTLQREPREGAQITSTRMTMGTHMRLRQ